MASDKELIYRDDARAAVLRAEPRAAFCIDRIKPVDAVEVVRCKGCCNCTKNMWCDLLMMNVKAEWYCFHGKRRN